MQNSIIYRNIALYRLVMNLLYLGGYKNRFKDVIDLLGNSDRSVVELCFGDTYFAEYCKQKGVSWTGYDISAYFVQNAVSKGYDAYHCDILKGPFLKDADVCVMIGSLYHFEKDIGKLLGAMINTAPKIILSEPIKNLTNSNRLLSYLSKKMTDAGKGEEQFRYTRKTVLDMLNAQQKELGFTYEIIKENRDILIMITRGYN